MIRRALVLFVLAGCRETPAPLPAESPPLPVSSPVARVLSIPSEWDQLELWKVWWKSLARRRLGALKDLSWQCPRGESQISVRTSHLGVDCSALIHANPGQTSLSCESPTRESAILKISGINCADDAAAALFALNQIWLPEGSGSFAVHGSDLRSREPLAAELTLLRSTQEPVAKLASWRTWSQQGNNVGPPAAVRG